MPIPQDKIESQIWKHGIYWMCSLMSHCWWNTKATDHELGIIHFSPSFSLKQSLSQKLKIINLTRLALQDPPIPGSPPLMMCDAHLIFDKRVGDMNWGSSGCLADPSPHLIHQHSSTLCIFNLKQYSPIVLVLLRSTIFLYKRIRKIAVHWCSIIDFWTIEIYAVGLSHTLLVYSNWDFNYQKCIRSPHSLMTLLSSRFRFWLSAVHIHLDSPTGPSYNVRDTEQERASLEYLLCLCFLVLFIIQVCNLVRTQGCLSPVLSIFYCNLVG